MCEYRDFFDEDDCCRCSPCYPKPRPPKPCGCVGPMGPRGPQGRPGPRGPSGPFLSNYIEAVGSTQSHGPGEDFVFDIGEEYLDIAGRGISLNASGTVFTITRPGLYHVEWSMNVSTGSSPRMIALVENGELSSVMSFTASPTTHSSGALINVTAVPFTISLRNLSEQLTVSDTTGYGNTAVSIRILRFADSAN